MPKIIDFEESMMKLEWDLLLQRKWFCNLGERKWLALDLDVSKKGSLCPGRLEGSGSREKLASLSGCRRWVWAPHWAPECFPEWLGVAQLVLIASRPWDAPWLGEENTTTKGSKAIAMARSLGRSVKERDRNGTPFCPDARYEPMMTKDQMLPPYPTLCYHQHLWELGCHPQEKAEGGKHPSDKEHFQRLSFPWTRIKLLPWGIGEMETEITPQKNIEKKHC